jgi:hypothetical protein
MLFEKTRNQIFTPDIGKSGDGKQPRSDTSRYPPGTDRLELVKESA